MIREDVGHEKFAKVDKTQNPWKLATLGQGPASGRSAVGPPFYHLFDFAVHPGLMGGESHLLNEMPSYLMMSENHYRKVTWIMR